MQPTAQDPIVIGRIGRPHGVLGELRVVPTGATLGDIAAGERLLVAGPDVEPRTVRVEASRVVSRGVLMRFEGVATREDAAALTGATVSVSSERLRALDAPDEFYVRDLVGCAVVADAPLGTVVDVYAGAANDALVVVDARGAQILVPFTKDAIVALDVSARLVRIRADLLGPGDA